MHGEASTRNCTKLKASFFPAYVNDVFVRSRLRSWGTVSKTCNYSRVAASSYPGFCNPQNNIPVPLLGARWRHSIRCFLCHPAGYRNFFFFFFLLYSFLLPAQVSAHFRIGNFDHKKYMPNCLKYGALVVICNIPPFSFPFSSINIGVWTNSCIPTKSGAQSGCSLARSQLKNEIKFHINYQLQRN